MEEQERPAIPPNRASDDESSAGSSGVTERPDRRRFLKTSAVAAAGAATLLTPKLSMAQGNEQVSPDHEPANFGDIDTTGFDPLDDTANIEITTLDFTRGFAAMIDSLINLDSGVKTSLLDDVSDLETAVEAADLPAAQGALQALLDNVVLNAAAIDVAAGVVEFEEVVSYSQIIIETLEFLQILEAELLGVLYVFETGQLFKIIEVFQVLVSWFTQTIITQFHIYARCWLFILAIRFRFFPGPSISIAMFLLLICICLQLTVTSTVINCLIEVRSGLLLVEC